MRFYFDHSCCYSSSVWRNHRQVDIQVSNIDLVWIFWACTVKSCRIHHFHPSIHPSTLRAVFMSWIIRVCHMFCFDSIHVMMVHDNLQSYYCVEGLVKREGLYVCQVTLQRYCSSTPESRKQTFFLEPSLPPSLTDH